MLVPSDASRCLVYVGAFSGAEVEKLPPCGVETARHMVVAGCLCPGVAAR
jgi:hypothetical protein